MAINYLDTIIVSFNNKLNYVVTKSGISELFKWMEGREFDGANLDEGLRHHNNQMAGLKTYPTTLNTDRMGQGIIRNSVIDYVNELGQYPEIPLDKGKGPDGGSFKDFLHKWFSDSDKPVPEKPSIVINQPGMDSNPTVTISPAHISEIDSTESSRVVTPRVISRTGSGVHTPPFYA